MPVRKIKLLGSGSFGEVYLVMNNKSKYALKQFINNDDNYDSYIRETDILSIVKHRNIANIIHFNENEFDLNIYMEYMNNGNLENYIYNNKKQNTSINYSEIKRIITQINDGLFYLHTHNVIHRDIKPSNILLSTHYIVKICDFGVSRIFDKNEKIKTFVGSPYYLAPEVINGKYYNISIDYWALGCIFYELCTFKKAFYSDSLLKVVEKINNCAYDITILNKKYHNIIQNLICLDKNKRYGYKGINDFFYKHLKLIPL